MARIAIVGTGISGLSAAYLLHSGHEITVYEKAASIGGHSRTKYVRTPAGLIPVDTGFIVFNYRNYPELCGLFKHLNVTVQKSDMSFGVSAQNGTLEWSAQTVASLFGQRSNLLKPRFYRMLIDILRFNRGARRLVRENSELTMGGLIARMRLSDWFQDYYILPMGAAIWSCPLTAILEFPARTFIDFFDAHGLLTVTDQPQWHTVTGGSEVYVKALTKPFDHRIRTSSAVTSVTRNSGKVQVTDAQGMQEYDHVIFACHADETLKLLADPSREESETLGAFTYQRNMAYLHSDTEIMPKRRKCWASWVYHAEADAPRDLISVTYWMNQLQDIDHSTPVFVTLNPLRPIREDLIHDKHLFEHPVYTTQSVAAQQQLPTLQGKRNSWFCGAYHRSGFHEDGLVSGMNVAWALGAQIPWH